MKKYCFLICFLMSICSAQEQEGIQETIVDTEPEVVKKVKETLLALLKYELEGKHDRAYGLMTDFFLNSFTDKNEYLEWSRYKFTSLKYGPPLKFPTFFIRKKIRSEDEINYQVQFTLADKKGKVLIADDSSCYLFTKRKGAFRVHMFRNDCNRYN